MSDVLQLCQRQLTATQCTRHWGAKEAPADSRWSQGPQHGSAGGKPEENGRGVNLSGGVSTGVGVAARLDGVSAERVFRDGSRHAYELQF